MVCIKCGIIGTDVRPNWKEQPMGESLTRKVYEIKHDGFRFISRRFNELGAT